MEWTILSELANSESAGSQQVVLGREVSWRNVPNTIGRHVKSDLLSWLLLTGMRHETSDKFRTWRSQDKEARGVTSIKSDRDEILGDLKGLDNKRGETLPRWKIPMLHGINQDNEKAYTSRLFQLQGSLPGFPGQRERWEAVGTRQSPGTTGRWSGSGSATTNYQFRCWALFLSSRQVPS